MPPYGASTYSKSRVAWGDDAPVYCTHADGWRCFADGADYCDMVMSLGSVILGHRNQEVNDAIRQQLSLGTTFSLGSDVEVAAAARVLRHFPEGYALQWGVNGTDATMGALRLARLVTKRPVVVMAPDGYHGFADWSLAGTTRGNGINPHHGRDIDRAELDDIISSPPKDVAAIIVEPDEHPDWLKPLRAWCDSGKVLLIFDEVMTWQRYPDFRAGIHYGVEPDLTCLGKSLANGMPVSAIVGPRDILRRFAPGKEPNAFFSMTWGGHPLSMAAVVATLDVMEREVGETDRNGCSWLWERAKQLNEKLHTMLAIGAVGFVVGEPPWNRMFCRTETHAQCFRRVMRQHGVLIYSAHNISLAHDNAAFDRLLTAWDEVLKTAPEDDDPLIAAAEDAAHGIMRR